MGLKMIQPPTEGMNHSTWAPPNQTSKTLFLIAHGTPSRDEPSQEEEPRLSSEGRRESLQIQNKIPRDAISNVEMVICGSEAVSMQTMELAFGRMLEWRDVPVFINHDLTSTQSVSSQPVSSENTTDEQKSTRFLRWIARRKEKCLFAVGDFHFLESLLDVSLSYGQVLRVLVTQTDNGTIKLSTSAGIRVIDRTVNDEIEAVGIL